MEVNHSMTIDEWLQLCEATGFSVEDLRDLTEAIKPNLLRLQWIAKGFFKFKLVSSILKRLVSPKLAQNAIAGLLMPLTVEAGAQGYWMVHLRKEIR